MRGVRKFIFQILLYCSHTFAVFCISFNLNLFLVCRVVQEAGSVLRRALEVTGDIAKAGLKVAETLGLSVVDLPISLLRSLIGSGSQLEITNGH